jgi:hypothetical protein
MWYLSERQDKLFQRQEGDRSHSEIDPNPSFGLPDGIGFDVIFANAIGFEA